MADDYVKLLKQQRELEKKIEAAEKQAELEKKEGGLLSLEGIEQFQRTLNSFGINFKLLDYVAKLQNQGSFVAKFITKDPNATLSDAIDKLRSPETIKAVKEKLGLNNPAAIAKNPALGFINTLFDNLVGPQGDPNKPDLKKELKLLNEEKAELAGRIKSVEKDREVEGKIRKAEEAEAKEKAKAAAAGAKGKIKAEPASDAATNPDTTERGNTTVTKPAAITGSQDVNQQSGTGTSLAGKPGEAAGIRQTAGG